MIGPAPGGVVVNDFELGNRDPQRRTEIRSGNSGNKVVQFNWTKDAGFETLPLRTLSFRR